MGVVVDTSILIDIERRHTEENLDALLDVLPGDAAMSAIQMGELRVGIIAADTSERVLSRERFLKRVLQRLPVIPFGVDEATEWAVIFAALRKGGYMVGERDLIIAAAALANGHSVMTNNLREFRQVPGLEVVAGPAS